MHGTLPRLPGSERRFKLTPGILAIIEEEMCVDDETTATQLVKIVNTAGYDISKRILHCIASRTLLLASFGLTCGCFRCLGFLLSRAGLQLQIYNNGLL